jgi:hypothetical protein
MRRWLGIAVIVTVAVVVGFLWFKRSTPAVPLPAVDPKIWQTQMHVVKAQEIRLLQAEGVTFWQDAPVYVVAMWLPATQQIDLTIQSYAEEMHRTIYLIEVRIQQTGASGTGKVDSRIVKTPTDRLLEGINAPALLNGTPNDVRVAQELAPQIVLAPQQAAEIVLREANIDPLRCPSVQITLQLSTTATPPRWQVEADCEGGTIRGTVHAGTGAPIQ